MAPSHNKITIHANHNLVLKIIQYDSNVQAAQRHNRPVTKTLDLLVRKQLVATSSFSTVLQSMMSSGSRESSQASIVLKDHNVDAVAVIFQESFRCSEDETFLDTDIDTVWEILNFSEKYQIRDIKEKVGAWFKVWFDWKMMNLVSNRTKPTVEYLLEFYAQLLYPAFTFDHAGAFQHATQYLAYNEVGAIEEQNPTDNDTLHLPRGVMHAIRAAKGRVRTICFRGLFEPTKPLLDDPRCNCHEKTYHGYSQRLYKLRIFPWEEHGQKTSINGMLERMKKFNWEPEAECCRTCNKISYSRHVANLAENVKAHFQGLCLDCMNRSMPKEGSDDRDYWFFSTIKHWNEKCRVKHTECSWYHSFMGRPERRREPVNERRNQKESD